MHYWAQRNGHHFFETFVRHLDSSTIVDKPVQFSGVRARGRMELLPHLTEFPQC